MYGGHGFGYFGGLMWLFWILLIVVIVWAVKAIMPADRNNQRTDKSPMEVLQDRFARGEIDEDEYQRRRKLLED